MLIDEYWNFGKNQKFYDDVDSVRGFGKLPTIILGIQDVEGTENPCDKNVKNSDSFSAKHRYRYTRVIKLEYLKYLHSTFGDFKLKKQQAYCEKVIVLLPDLCFKNIRDKKRIFKK